MTYTGTTAAGHDGHEHDTDGIQSGRHIPHQYTALYVHAEYFADQVSILFIVQLSCPKTYWIFMPPDRQGILFLSCLSVCLSVVNFNLRLTFEL